MAKKITKESIEKFKEYCNAWIEKLNLKNWYVKVIQDADVLDNGIADVYTNLSSRRSTITVNIETEEEITDDFLNRVAFHECMHILLNRMKHTFVERNSEFYDDAEHEVIRTIENLILDSSA